MSGRSFHALNFQYEECTGRWLYKHCQDCLSQQGMSGCLPGWQEGYHNGTADRSSLCLFFRANPMQNRSVTLLHTYTCKGQIQAAGIISGPNHKPHQNTQAMLISPPNHASPRTLTSCRSWNSDMSSLMKPCVETCKSPIGNTKAEGRG